VNKSSENMEANSHSNGLFKIISIIVEKILFGTKPDCC
jgi:hypothetical protein